MQSSDNDYTNEPENAKDTKSVLEPSEEPNTSAIMNDFDYAKNTEPILSSSLKLVSSGVDFAKSIKSLLLMPRVGMRFKVTFTEAELHLTFNMSAHHRKCYKLLKYIMNGEPIPLESHKSRIFKYLGVTHTFIHSYMLKRIVWEHHYIRQCDQEMDLGMCFIILMN